MIHLCLGSGSTESIKKCIKKESNYTFEKAKAIVKLEEGASQQIKSITHNSNVQTRSKDNIQDPGKPRSKLTRGVKEMEITKLDLSLPTKALEATIMISRNKEVITIVSDKKSDHSLSNRVDFQIAIMYTCTTQDSSNHKLTPTKCGYRAHLKSF